MEARIEKLQARNEQLEAQNELLMNDTDDLASASNAKLAKMQRIIDLKNEALKALRT